MKGKKHRRSIHSQDPHRSIFGRGSHSTRRDSISGWAGVGRLSSRDPQGCISSGTFYGVRAWLVGDRRVCIWSALRVISKNNTKIAGDTDATTKLDKPEIKYFDSPTGETSRCSRKRLQKCFSIMDHGVTLFFESGGPMSPAAYYRQVLAFCKKRNMPSRRT